MPSWERGFDPRAKDPVWTRDWNRNPILGPSHIEREGIRSNGLPFSEKILPSGVTYRDGRKLFPSEHIQKR
ncbi:MAG: hypothetical protein KGJ86_03980 [Chloroflexota bacterium]|nr:hypothetical protein [Chloroflexota bacterium]